MPGQLQSITSNESQQCPWYAAYQQCHGSATNLAPVRASCAINCIARQCMMRSLQAASWWAHLLLTVQHEVCCP
jgi:hypothetical protein